MLYWWIIVFLFSLRIGESDCGTIDEVQGDLRTKVPWTVAIFMRADKHSSYEYVENGVVIGPWTILTVFGKTFGEPLPGEANYRIPSPANILVIAGLKSTNFQDWDNHTQISQISYISPYRGHRLDNKEYHFVLIHLSARLNLETSFVRAICHNGNLANSQSSLSRKFSLSGFTKSLIPNSSLPSTLTPRLGYKKENLDLRIFDIKISRKTTCENLFSEFYQGSTNQIFCGSPLFQTHDYSCISSRGSVLVTQFKNRWYLKGVGALILEKVPGNYCNENTTYFFGDPTRVLPWITNSQKCEVTRFYCGESSGCIHISKLCNVEHDCNNGEDENPTFCKASNHCPNGTFRCGLVGDCLSKRKLCNGVNDCPDGSDELFQVCDAYRNVEKDHTLITKFPTGLNNSPNKKICKLLQISEGVVSNCIEYSPEETSVNCSLARVGAQAILSCDNHYHSTYRLPTIKMICKEDGRWGPFRPFACAPDCGRIGGGFQLYVAHGIKSSSEFAFPWYSAIYLWTGTAYIFICGGSLVERSALITAAHCVTKDNGELTAVELYRVVFSPVSSEFVKNSEDRFTEIAEIKQVFIPNSYDPKILQSDIAIMIFKSPVTLGDFIRPICYAAPFFPDLPEPGTIGKVPGLGIDETNKISKVLKYANLPVVSNQECKIALDRIVPLNTFCAGYKNGTSVCSGDSGSGLIFPEPNDPTGRYVLKGIVSHSELGNRFCDLENYAVFTQVDGFSNWILEILGKFQ